MGIDNTLISQKKNRTNRTLRRPRTVDRIGSDIRNGSLATKPFSAYRVFRSCEARLTVGVTTEGEKPPAHPNH
jgi:hypothetical protein